MSQNRSMQLQPGNHGQGNPESGETIDLPVIHSRHSPYPFLLQEESPVLHYRRILIKRKWWIIATFLIVFSLSTIRALMTVPLYEATSKIAIYPENSNVLGFKDGMDAGQFDADYEASLETQAAILRSDALAMNVIEAMRLDANPGFSSSGRIIPSNSGIRISNVNADPAKIAGLLGTFRRGLKIQIIPNSRLVQIYYTHPDPKLASEIANGLVKTFIEQNFKTRYESVTQTSEWLSKELLDLQMKVETSQEKLVRYQKDHSILGIDDKQNIVMAKLDELNKELTAAQSERIEREANYKFATSGDPDLFVKAAAPSEQPNILAKLQEKEADLSVQLAQTRTLFGAGYPKVTELSNQLNEARAEIAAQEKVIQEKLRNEYLGALQREELLTAAFEQQKQEANKLNESAIEYSVLKRDADSNRQLYDNLLQKLKEAGVSAGLRSSEIRVVDVARTPTAPISPDVPRNLTLGFLLGLAGGIGLAFLVDALDRTVRTIDEVTAISGFPALGTIPLQMSLNRNLGKRAEAIANNGNTPALVTFVRPRSEAAEAFRALRTSILLSASGDPPKVILVTSALPQEGKTTVSANAAVVLAQRGSRVLLVDADLRRPGIGRLFGLHPQGGVSTLISGVDKFEDVVVPHPEIPNLWILPAGPIPPQPAELLSSVVMKNHMDTWRKSFDHIILDSPPCLSVTDAVVLSPDADRVLLVARSAQTTKIALRRACDLLLQVNAKVMGVVLNALNLRALDGYSYYTYGGNYAAYYIEDAKHNEAEASTKVS